MAWRRSGVRIPIAPPASETTLFGGPEPPPGSSRRFSRLFPPAGSGRSRSRGRVRPPRRFGRAPVPRRRRPSASGDRPRPFSVGRRPGEPPASGAAALPSQVGAGSRALDAACDAGHHRRRGRSTGKSQGPGETPPEPHVRGAGGSDPSGAAGAARRGRGDRRRPGGAVARLQPVSRHPKAPERAGPVSGGLDAQWRPGGPGSAPLEQGSIRGRNHARWEARFDRSDEEIRRPQDARGSGDSRAEGERADE